MDLTRKKHTQADQINIDQYLNVPFKKRTSCKVCGEKMQEPILEWPDLPMTEIYSTKKVDRKAGFADQTFHLCSRCGQGQLANVIEPDLQYGSQAAYRYRMSESATGRESGDFFLAFLDEVLRKKSYRQIVEIGCNDLYLLKLLRSRAKQLIGVDPLLKGVEKDLTAPKLRLVGDLFENVDLEGRPDIVICKDTLEHMSDPLQVLRRMVASASNDALFFCQFPLLDTLVAGGRFDQIFHQHLNYFSLKSILYLLDELGCELHDYTINYNHWAAILIAFRKIRKGGTSTKFFNNIWNISRSDILQRYNVFRKNMELTQERLLMLRNESLYGYGAALMLPVLSYHLKNDLSCLKYVLDDDGKKEGLYYINLPVSIRHPKKVRDIKKSTILVTAIASTNNVRRILSRLSELNPRQIILPLNTL